MNNFLTKLLGGLSGYVIPIVAGVCFSSGLYVSHVWHGYKETKQLQDIQNQVVKQATYNNGIITDLQSQQVVSETKYNTLKDKLHATKITTTPCTLTSDAVKLWNQSSGATEVLPTDTSGTTEDTSSTRSLGGITLERAFESKIEEDKEYNEARDRIIKLNEWNLHTYGN